MVPLPLREHAKLGLPSPLHSWMLSETLNYIHETPEQMSACAPQWPYSNQIQFYPCAERLDSNRPVSSRVRHTNTYLNTLDPVSNLSFSRTTPVGRCDWHLLSGIVFGCCFSGRQNSLTINPSCVPSGPKRCGKNIHPI